MESGGSWLISSWLIDSALFCCKPFMICCDLSSTSAASLEEHSWLIGRYLLGPRMGDAVGGKKPLPRLLLLTPARRREINQHHMKMIFKERLHLSVVVSLVVVTLRKFTPINARKM